MEVAAANNNTVLTFHFIPTRRCMRMAREAARHLQEEELKRKKKEKKRSVMPSKVTVKVQGGADSQDHHRKKTKIKR